VNTTTQFIWQPAVAAEIVKWLALSASFSTVTCACRPRRQTTGNHTYDKSCRKKGFKIDDEQWRQKSGRHLVANMVAFYRPFFCLSSRITNLTSMMAAAAMAASGDA
jgi:hypothetical protein